MAFPVSRSRRCALGVGRHCHTILHPVHPVHPVNRCREFNHLRTRDSWWVSRPRLSSKKYYCPTRTISPVLLQHCSSLALCYAIQLPAQQTYLSSLAASDCGLEGQGVPTDKSLSGRFTDSPAYRRVPSSLHLTRLCFTHVKKRPNEVLLCCVARC